MESATPYSKGSGPQHPKNFRDSLFMPTRFDLDQQSMWGTSMFIGGQPDPHRKGAPVSPEILVPLHAHAYSMRNNKQYEKLQPNFV